LRRTTLLVISLATAAMLGSALGLGAVIPANATPTVASNQVTTDPAWPVDTRGDGCSSPTWPVADKSEKHRRVLLVGDSLFRESRTELERRATEDGWLPTVRCWGAKGTDWGLQQVIRARQRKELPQTVVVSLGTNDIWWLGLDLGRGVDALMAEIGPKREVYWVNLWFGPHSYDRLPTPHAANRLLRAKAKQYDNLNIVNFAKAFRKADARDPAVGWEDGVHLNAAGNRVRVNAIMKALGNPEKSKG
jgi:hypothetical protein